MVVKVGVAAQKVVAVGVVVDPGDPQLGIAQTRVAPGVDKAVGEGVRTVGLEVVGRGIHCLTRIYPT